MSTRYSRQERFAPIGKDGQQKIRQSSVFILGAGALGSSSGEMLVRAGVGKVTIVDRDIIEWTNLHRQQLYSEQDVLDQLPKAVAAEKRLLAMNSEVEVISQVIDITPDNILSLIEGHDVVLDATDNIETRLIANDAALKLRIPFFMGACVGSYGLTFPIGIEENQPCLHCLLETMPPQTMTCETVGVISPIVVTTAARQVADVLKYLTGNELVPKLESADLWTGDRASINVGNLKRDTCPSCSRTATYPFLTADHSIRTAVLCGRDTVQLSWPQNRPFELAKFAETLKKSVSKLVYNPHLLACEYNNYRLVMFRDGRMLIHGTKDVIIAKNIAAELLG